MKGHGTTLSASSSELRHPVCAGYPLLTTTCSLYSKLGPRLKVVALIDPSAQRADAALKVKRESFVLSAYKDTVVYPSFEDYVKKRPQDQTPE